MLSRKNNSKIGLKAYIKEHDPLYCGLLKLACVTDHTDYGVEELQQAVDTFNYLADYVKVHQRLLPLLYAKARHLGIFKQLTEQTQRVLVQSLQQGIITELAKSKQLKQILEILSTQHIPVILLKGVAFSKLLYASDAPRTSNDIDLLVKKEQWQQAQTAMDTIMVYKQKAIPDVLADVYEVSFKPLSKIGNILDLHRGLTHPGLFNITEQALWQNSVIHPYFNDTNVRTLSPEQSLIHQAIHAYTDMNFCKYNLLDSHEIINTLKPDIALTIEIAKDWGASVSVYYLLKNCIEIMDSKIDATLLHSIQPSKLRHYVADKLLRSKFAQPTATKKLIRYRINQLISQFVFCGSIKRACNFQWMFIKIFCNIKLNKIIEKANKFMVLRRSK
jgi:hypothetical protein